VRLDLSPASSLVVLEPAPGLLECLADGDRGASVRAFELVAFAERLRRPLAGARSGTRVVRDHDVLPRYGEIDPHAVAAAVAMMVVGTLDEHTRSRDGWAVSLKLFEMLERVRLEWSRVAGASDSHSGCGFHVSALPFLSRVVG
jgi:hypothetical protein